MFVWSYSITGTRYPGTGTGPLIICNALLEGPAYTVLPVLPGTRYEYVVVNVFEYIAYSYISLWRPKPGTGR